MLRLMDWYERETLKGKTAELLVRLREERLVWDTKSAADLEALRRDVRRIADDMDDPERPPPMFWSGIEWPPPGPEPSCDYHLVLSVGGTKTDFALLRLEKGRPLALDLSTGKEVSAAEEIDRCKDTCQSPTPKHGKAVSSGMQMIQVIVRHLAGHLRSHRPALERCEAILLSWGFAHRVIRTGPRLAGGLSARVTKMTKDQAGFTEDLAGKDIGILFDRELRAQLGWSRPIAVANDTVMALHYFLSPKERTGHARVGLFINGTGTNFSAAEPYAVRPEGFLSAPGEDYTPDLITSRRPLRPGEREIPFFVNYESGSIELELTRTRFDTDAEYPIERNVLAGGKAFPHELRAFVTELISPLAYVRLQGASQTATGESVPGAPVVSALAWDSEEELPGFRPPGEERAQLRLIARAIIARSALHAALVLAAVTSRTGFGKGQKGLPDLLGMEGSVWKIPGYADLVKSNWQDLAGAEPLHIDFRAEPSFNASLSGPLYLAALHK